MTKFRNLRTALIASVSCTMFTPVAFAQDEPAAADTGDIVVTALRQQYRGDVPLKELPQSVSVLSSEMLEDAGISRILSARERAQRFLEASAR